MRKSVFILAFALTATVWTGAQQQPAQTAAPQPMLTVDSIMRGPKLVGTPPTAIRWSKDSSKLYFSWQKATDTRSATYAVNRDGTGLKALTPEEIRAIETPRTGRFDRARRRVLVVENGDIAVYDTASGARRPVTRTSAAESNPRWARNDSAVTFVRDGNLFVMSLEAAPADAVAFAQLTDIVAPDAAAPAPGGPRAGGTGARRRRGAAAGARPRSSRNADRRATPARRQARVIGSSATSGAEAAVAAVAARAAAAAPGRPALPHAIAA
jgi:hypothetical protein